MLEMAERLRVDSVVVIANKEKGNIGLCYGMILIIISKGQCFIPINSLVFSNSIEF